MEPAGWIVMLLSFALVLGLLSFCFYRIFKSPASTGHMHAPLNIETTDESD